MSSSFENSPAVPYGAADPGGKRGVDDGVAVAILRLVERADG
jgi:hypothetical protein